MGVKISLPPPGAGGPAGPDAGRLPGSSRWPVTRGRHICRPYGLTVYSRPIMSHPVGAGLCSARGSYPGNGVRGKRAGRACPAPTEQQKFARTYPTTNKKWALPRGGAPIHSTTNSIVPDGFQRADFYGLVGGQDTGHKTHQRGKYQRCQHQPRRNNRDGVAAAAVHHIIAAATHHTGQI